MRLDTIRRLLAPLRSRIAAGIARGVVKLVDDAGGLQTVQAELLAGEIRARLEVFHPYGFTSVPLAGAEAVVVCPLNVRENAVAVVVGDRRYRLTGQPEGSVSIHDDAGQRVSILPDRIEIQTTNPVVVDAPTLEVTGDLEVGGNVEVTGNVAATDVEASGDVSDSVGTLADFRTAYNGHTHAETGSTTGPPTPTA